MTTPHISPAARAARAAVFPLVALCLAACGAQGEPPAFPPPQVNVATPIEKPVSEWDSYEGRVEAVDRVEIRPRVAGYLGSVNYVEGALVAKGDLLFRIDDREYRAALASARADRARADSRLELAQQELQRSERLVVAKAVSEEELQIRRAELAQAEADRQAAQARVEQAELTLGFTEIRAPIAGRAGAALVKPGNLVAPNQSLLTTVVSLDPVYVVFDSDEQAFLRQQALARNGRHPADEPHPVRVGLSNEDGYPHRGRMAFVDNTLNPATGTIRVRAELANPDGTFTPGLFARVQLRGQQRERALLIHEQALLTDQDRRYVYVVGANNAAERRDLVLGPIVDGLRIVESGLQPGDRVIVNGTRKIFFPGQPIAPVEVPMDDPNAQPAQPAPSDAPVAATEG